MWKPTKKWGPPRQTGSRPIAVEQVGSENTLGLAKQRGMYNEKLASDLADLARVRVPRVEFGDIDGNTGPYAISHVHGVESNDLAAVRQQPTTFNLAVVQEAIARASGLIAFYAWTGVTDLKDDHLVLDRELDGQYHVTGVDFESAFAWAEADGGAVNAPGIPPALAPKIDRARVAEAVAAIEAVTDAQIQQIVNALPTSVGAAEKQRITGGLIGRRSKVRARMQMQGWLT